MDEKVVAIRPALQSVPQFAEPNPDVVQFARDLLERAEAGEVIGVACAMTHHDNSHSYETNGRATLATIGNVERMKAYMCRRFDDLAAGDGSA